MKVIHEYTGEIIDYDFSQKVVIGEQDGHMLFGYVSPGETEDVDIVKSNYDTFTAAVYYDLPKQYKIYSNYYGKDIVCFNQDKDFINKLKYTKGFGRFPYSFARHYEAIESFDIFKGEQIEDDSSNIGKLLNYSFGLEFETSRGYIPENKCFENGLIPLRDGSITGLEYSTVVLEGEQGVNTLKRAVKDLNNYTLYDENCSLHMHLGGFPLDEKKIWSLYKYIYKFQFLIQPYISDYAFETHYFKPNHKDYCKKLPLFKNFDAMYKYFTEMKFYGDFYQAHPNDRFHEAKWRIPGRYYMCNFINLLCYNENKTVEFRFLHPTFNLNRIIWWMLMFNAILYHAEHGMKLTQIQRIEDFFKIYPRKIQKQMFLGLQDLLELKRLQLKSGDKFDMNNLHEYQVFSNLNLDF